MSHTTSIDYAFDRVRAAKANLRHKKLAGRLAKEEIAEAREELLEASQTLARVSTAISQANESVSEDLLIQLMARRRANGLGNATAQAITKQRGTTGRGTRGQGDRN